MRIERERGSALMLVPAGILILVILAAIAVDSAIAFGAQRELINRASGAANDAVTAALTEDDLQRGRLARPSPNEVDRMVKTSLVGTEVSGYRLKATDISVQTNDDTVQVRITAPIAYVFAPAVPGMKDHTAVTASATAQLEFS